MIGRLLAHDRLIAPVRNNNKTWFDQHLSALQRAADAWNQQGRTDGFLLFGNDYLDADEWAQKNADILLDHEQTFLNTCKKFHEQQKLERRTNFIVRVLLAVSLVALAAAVFLFIKAKQEENYAETEQLAASSLRDLRVDPVNSLLLAVEAVQNTQPPRPNAVDALHRSLPSMRLIHTYYGHTDRVYGISYSPDGLLLASSSRDGSIKIWDATGATREALHTFVINPDPETNGAGNTTFSPNGSLLAGVSGQGEIILWDTSTWQEIRRKTAAHAGKIWGLTFSPDGKMLLTGGSDSLVKLWDVSDLSEIHAFDEHQESINAVAFSPDGTMIASASDDRTAKVWRVLDFSQVASYSLAPRILSNPPRMSSVTFNLDNSRLISTSTDGNVYVWDIASGAQIMKISGHDDWVYGVLVRAGSDADAVQGEIISAGADRSIRIWGGLYGRSKLELRGHTDQVYSLAINPIDDGLLASASADHTVRVWDISWAGNYERFTKDMETEQGVPGYAEDVDYNPQGTLLAIPVSLAKNPNDPFPNYGLPGEILLIDPRTGELSGLPLRGHKSGVFAVDFDSSGRRLVSASLDKTAIVWDIETRAALLTLEHDNIVYSADYSPNDWWIVTGTQAGEVVVWDALTGARIKTFPYQDILGTGSDKKVVAQAQFNTDSTLIAIQYREDKYIYLIDAQTGALAMTLRGHEDIVRDIDFSLDGATLVSVGDDARMILWDLTPGIPDDERELMDYKEHLATIFSVTFSTLENEEYILSAGADGVVKVWSRVDPNKDDWEVAYTLRSYAFANDDTILDIEISPTNENEVAAVVNDWTVRGFTLSKTELLDLAKQRLRVNIDCREPEELDMLEQEICTMTP